jgi:hypothetical protein
MIAENFKKALKTLSERFKEKNLKWALTGSVNMALQGIEIELNDIDIIVNLEDFKKIKEMFSDLRPSAAEKSKFGGLKFKLVIGGAEVEIIGEARNDKIYLHSLLEKNLTHVNMDGIKIPCFTLKLEAKAYSLINREEKAELIRKFIEENNY